MENNNIEQCYKDIIDLCEYLESNNQRGYVLYVKEVLKKYLVLSVASYFESKITESILDYASQCCINDNRIVKLVDSRVVKRQYHTFFSWNENKTNSFWAMFGNETKKHVRNKIDRDTDLTNAEKNFMDLGKKRNELVHNDLAGQRAQYTPEEIYEQYKSASKFVSLIKEVLQPEYRL